MQNHLTHIAGRDFAPLPPARRRRLRRGRSALKAKRVLEYLERLEATACAAAAGTSLKRPRAHPRIRIVVDSRYEGPVLQLLETVDGKSRWSGIRADSLRPIADRVARYAQYLPGLDAYALRLRGERREWRGG